MNNDLNFYDFIEMINLKSVSSYIRNINIKLIKAHDKKTDLILIFDNIINTLENIDLIIKSKTNTFEDEDIKMQAIKQLIIIHQQILEYRMSEDLTEDENKAINKLCVLYPIFIFGNAFENDLVDQTDSQSI